MSVRNALRSLCVLVALGLLSSTAWALQVGLTFQAHQDITNPDLWPNDFHVTGKICSPDYPPILMDHEDGLFTGFSWTVVPTGDPCWYEFEASWWLPKGVYIPYCQIIRVGVLVDIDDKNVIINVKSWWTRDGVPVGSKAGSLYNDGFYPVLGFNVEDSGRTQFMTLANGVVSDAPAASTFGPAPGAGIKVDIAQFDLITFPAGKAPDFKVLCEGCEQESWKWVPVAFPDGKPISVDNPFRLAPDTATDVVLQQDGSGALQPVMPMVIDRGGFLVARQLIGFINNSGEYERKWQFEVHESALEEACCFPDGTCQMLQPFPCFEQGGTPKGYGSYCTSDVCPEIVEPGACCYGDPGPQCTVTDYLKCRDGYLGLWKGPGTDCDDWDGDGLADVCEPITTTYEACCFDGDCKMMDPKECVAAGGKPQGVGSMCIGDLDGDGRDDTCEAKWLQPPDVNPTGIDVDDTKPLALADDFLCTETNAITRIVVWGSWLRDQYPVDPANVSFTLMIREDIPDPDGTGPAFSMPGKVLWSRSFKPYGFKVEPYRTDIKEGWWNPQSADSYVFPGDTVCWMYTFDIPAKEAFCQQGTATKPIVYWLDVQATIPATPSPTPVLFGWKTSAKHWNDDGVWQYRSDTAVTPFHELRYPTGHPWVKKSADLAFALETEPCIVTPTEPAEVLAK